MERVSKTGQFSFPFGCGSIWTEWSVVDGNCGNCVKLNSQMPLARHDTVKTCNVVCLQYLCPKLFFYNSYWHWLLNSWEIISSTHRISSESDIRVLMTSELICGKISSQNLHRSRWAIKTFREFLWFNLSHPKVLNHIFRMSDVRLFPYSKTIINYCC